MEEQEKRKINLEQAIRELDNLFEVDVLNEENEQQEGSFRIGNEYHILTSKAYNKADNLSKVFAYFSKTQIEDSQECNIICNVEKNGKDYAVIKFD